VNAARSQTAFAGVAVAVAVAWAFTAPTSQHFYGVLSVSYALMALSVMILAGWTGQVSLAQAAFLGIGVYSTEKLLNAGLPLPLTLATVALLGAAVSLVIGLPSLRLKGVYLTIVTLAFNAACEKFVFPLEQVRGAFAGDVPRASFFGFPTTANRDLFLVALLVLVGALIVVRNIRGSDLGRTFFAIRDSEDGAQAMGVKLARYKVGAFALSAAFATVAGSFYALLFQATPAASQFGVLSSFFLLALPVIGGLGSLTGAVVGGVLLATAQPVVNLFGIRLFLATGVGLIVIVLARTDGIVGALRSVLVEASAIRNPPARAGSFVPRADDEESMPPVLRVMVRHRGHRPPAETVPVRARYAIRDGRP
jgi:branched-chain amino acid transport system permease protein